MDLRVKLRLCSVKWKLKRVKGYLKVIKNVHTHLLRRLNGQVKSLIKTFDLKVYITKSIFHILRNTHIRSYIGHWKIIGISKRENLIFFKYFEMVENRFERTLTLFADTTNNSFSKRFALLLSLRFNPFRFTLYGKP